ncbi:MAG: hypothetical protein NT154_43125 [Verrucomicrobia bacterium]|nr:hypothetical protein [Verrucomicrobiota bacterium]
MKTIMQKWSYALPSPTGGNTRAIRACGRGGRQVMEPPRKVAYERGAGVIVVAHDHHALAVFDRVVEMENGQIRFGQHSL